MLEGSKRPVFSKTPEQPPRLRFAIGTFQKALARHLDQLIPAAAERFFLAEAGEPYLGPLIDADRRYLSLMARHGRLELLAERTGHTELFKQGSAELDLVGQARLPNFLRGLKPDLRSEILQPQQLDAPLIIRPDQFTPSLQALEAKWPGSVIVVGTAS